MVSAEGGSLSPRAGARAGFPRACSGPRAQPSLASEGAPCKGGLGCGDIARRHLAWGDDRMNARVPISKPKLVVVGNGMAGMRTVEELLKLAPDAYDITVLGSE